MDDLDAMSEALEEARRALAHGDVPIGAVAVLDGEVVARAHNERELRRDPTAHAELLLLQQVATQEGSWRLAGLTVVVTLEPCIMCSGGLLAARVGRLVYGADDPKGGACGSLYNVCADPRLNHEITVVPRVRAEECGRLLGEFFAGLR